jgi:hypothetical protein
MLVSVQFVDYLTTLFNNADYTASNVSMMSTLQNEKDLEGSGRGLNLRHYTGTHLEVLRKSTKTSVRITGLRAEI